MVFIQHIYLMDSMHSKLC